MKRLGALILAAALVALPVRAEAAPFRCDTSWADVVSLIGYYADDVFGVDKSVLYAVAQLETGSRHCVRGAVVLGDGGASVGVFQWHRFGAWSSTPEAWRGYGAFHDPEVNVRNAAWYLWRHGHMCPWTGYRVAYGGCASR